MKIITTILSLFITLNSFASSLLDDAYNSIGISYSSTFGDVVASGTTGSIIFKPENVDFVLSYSTADVDYDEVLGHDVSSVKGDGDSFGLGYVMSSDSNSHIIPFISSGHAELSHSDRSADVDITSFGIIFRTLSGENSVLNIFFEHVNYDELSFSQTLRNDINEELGRPLTKAEFDNIEDELAPDKTILGVSLEYHYEENVSLSYGLSTDFDTAALSLNLAWNY